MMVGVTNFIRIALWGKSDKINSQYILGGSCWG